MREWSWCENGGESVSHTYSDYNSFCSLDAYGFVTMSLFNQTVSPCIINCDFYRSGQGHQQLLHLDICAIHTLLLLLPSKASVSVTMFTTATTTLIFPLLTALFTLCLSTIEIYPAPSTSTLHDPTAISQTGMYDHDNPPTSDFLFRLGKLQIYGIRRLFMGVVISTSTLAIVLVSYVAFAHRRTVEWDVSERWRFEAPVGRREQEEWRNSRWYPAADEVLSPSWRASTMRRSGYGASNDRRMGVVTGRRISIAVSPAAWSPRSTTRLSFRLHLRRRSRELNGLATPERSKVQAQVVSFLGARTPKSDSQLCRLEEEVALECERAEALRDSFAKALSDSTSGYEVPSYYLQEELDDSSKTVSRAECTPAKRTSAEGIPSYYFKEHDEDGRSMPSAVEDEKRASFEMAGTAILARISETAPAYEKGILMGTDGVVEGTAHRVPSEYASSTPSTPMTEKNGSSRRSVLSGETRTSGIGARTSEGKADTAKDDGWEAVYCSEWKGR